LHFANPLSSGPISITHSRIEGQGDDCMNINVAMGYIKAISEDRKQIRVEGYVKSNPLVTGDTVNVMNTNLQWMQQIGSITVVGPNTVNLTEPLIAAAKLYDVAYAANDIPTNVKIAHNYFGQNRARGILIKAFTALLTNNTFDRNSGMAILTQSDVCWWFEGATVDDFTVIDNQFVAANGGPAASYGDVTVATDVPEMANGVPNGCTTSPYVVQYNVTVNRNTFVNNVNSGVTTSVWVSNVDGVAVSDNVITRQSGVPVPAAELEGSTCTGTVANGNTCNGGNCTISGL
jgi:hypothetical protein